MPPPRAVGSGCPSPLLTTPEHGAALCGLVGLRFGIVACQLSAEAVLGSWVMLSAGFCSRLWTFPWLVIALRAGRAWQVHGRKRELPSSETALEREYQGTGRVRALKRLVGPVPLVVPQ